MKIIRFENDHMVIHYIDDGIPSNMKKDDAHISKDMINKVWHNDKGPAHWFKSKYISTIEYSWWFNDQELGRSTLGYTQEKFEQYLKLIIFL